jgi:hypothetical protein
MSRAGLAGAKFDPAVAKIGDDVRSTSPAPRPPQPVGRQLRPVMRPTHTHLRGHRADLIGAAEQSPQIGGDRQLSSGSALTTVVARGPARLVGVPDRSGVDRTSGRGWVGDGHLPVAAAHACGLRCGDTDRGVSGAAAAGTGAQIPARAAPATEPAPAAPAAAAGGAVRLFGSAAAACVIDAGAAATCGDSDAAGARTGRCAPLTVPNVVGVGGVCLACAASGASACAACGRIVGGSTATTADEQHVGAEQHRGSATSTRAGDGRVGGPRRASRAAGPVAVSAATTGPGWPSLSDRLARAAHDDGVDRAGSHGQGGFRLTSQAGGVLHVETACRAVDNEGGLGHARGNRPTLSVAGVVEGDGDRALGRGQAVPADASDRSDIESPPGSADRPIDRVSLPTRPTRRRTPLATPRPPAGRASGRAARYRCARGPDSPHCGPG